MTAGGRGPAVLIAVLSMAVLVAGCGSDAAPSPSPTPTDVPLPTPVTTTYATSVTTWYGGLVIHVDGFMAVLRAGVGSVAASMRIENPGTDAATLTAPIRLTSGGAVAEPARGTSLPDLDAGGSASVLIRFDVVAGFDVASATLRIGRSTEHQVVVPLTPGVADLVTNAPQTLELAPASVTAGSLRVTIRGAVLRADLPDWGLELPPGVLALTLTYDARYVGQFAGGFAFTGANVGLRLPDGTVVGPRQDGQSQSTAVLLPGAAATGLGSRFEVPIPGPGKYALIVRDGSSNASIPIVIKAPAAGG